MGYIIHNQTMKLVSEQLSILYKNGEYRDDKRHLLGPNASHLNVKLLKVKDNYMK